MTFSRETVYITQCSESHAKPAKAPLHKTGSKGKIDVTQGGKFTADPSNLVAAQYSLASENKTHVNVILIHICNVVAFMQPLKLIPA